MQVPLEVRFDGISKNEKIEELIRRKAASLEKVCDYMISCRVLVRKYQNNQRTGNRFLTQIDMRVPPGHEIVIKRKTAFEDTHEYLTKMIREAFDAAFLKLKELVARQQDYAGRFSMTPDLAFVERLFPDGGYGFLKTAVDGREIYFHKNSVLYGGFDKLKIGTEVRFVEEAGVKGPQASTIEIISSYVLGPTK